jgi:hypothetical protein
MILTNEELRGDPDLRIAREMELDPTFVPCRDERCDRDDLHREHPVSERRGPKIRAFIGAITDEKEESHA